MNNTSSNNLNDHIIVKLGAAVATTIGLCIIVATQVIFPTQQAAIINHSKNLENQLKKVEKNKTLLSKNLAITKKELDFTKKRLELLQNANLFNVGDPYPAGLGQLRIGDPINKADQVFPKDSIEHSEGNISVNGQHKIFKDITYFYDDESKNNPITHISFGMDVLSKSDAFLQEKLVEALDKPKKWKRKEFFSWRANLGLAVYKSSDFSYILIPNDKVPGYWPDK